MNFLIDENLSAKLCVLLSGHLGKLLHVCDAGLAGADDRRLWEYAIMHECAIISKDSDFLHRALLRKSPSPKVIWIDLGNLSTTEIAHHLIKNADDIMHFIHNAEEVVYILS